MSAARHIVGSQWNAYDFRVQMPHMAPGEKLSEVELLKLLAAYQWESIARALHQRPPEIANAQSERLYGSVLDVELHFGPDHSLDVFGEDAVVHVRNRVQFYAHKFVEGLFLLDTDEIPDSAVESLHTRQDVSKLPGTWACMTNAFIARTGGNVRLKVFRPVGAESAEGQPLESTPFGISEQGRVQASGEIAPFDEAPAHALEDGTGERIVYPIVPESDLNGAGLVYFARYEAMMNYGERVFLAERQRPPISHELIAGLSTDRRRVFFFANASPNDSVQIEVRAHLLAPGSFAPTGLPRGYKVPFKLLFRTDLYRDSDHALMASSLVRKSLHVPGGAKAVLNEADRILRRLRA